MVSQSERKAIFRYRRASFMASRNHFEWAKWEDDELKVGVYEEARKLRREAIEAEKRAKEVLDREDQETAWKETQEARVKGYQAAKAEDMRM